MLVNRTTCLFILTRQRQGLVLLLLSTMLALSACVDIGPPVEQMRKSTLQIICIPKASPNKQDFGLRPFAVGSGFIVGKEGKHVVTNQHVWEGCNVLNNRDQLLQLIENSLKELEETELEEEGTKGQPTKRKTRKEKVREEKELKEKERKKKELKKIMVLLEFLKDGNGKWVIGILSKKEDDDEIEEKPVDARHIDVPAWKDLAILEFARSLKREPVTFAATEAKVGQTVYALGFPEAAEEGMRGSMTVTSGIISDDTSISDEGLHYYQVSAALNPGNSGGPLVDDDGHLLGLVRLKSLVTVPTVDEKGEVTFRRVSSGEGIGWAIRASELLPELRRLQIDVGEPSVLEVNPVRRLLRRHPTIFPLSVGAFIFSSVALTLVFIRRRDKPKTVSKAPAEVKKRTFLAGVSGHLKGQTFDVDGTSVALGRDPKECQVIFPPDMTSIGRKHCTVRYDKASQSFFLEDCGSRNGTFLSTGEKLRAGEPRRLRSGDKFYLSDPTTMFEVRWE